MKSGLYERPGVSATAWAAAWASRLDEAATKVSKVNFESSWTAGDSRPPRLAPGPNPASRSSPLPYPFVRPAVAPDPARSEPIGVADRPDPKPEPDPERVPKPDPAASSLAPRSPVASPTATAAGAVSRTSSRQRTGEPTSLARVSS